MFQMMSIHGIDWRNSLAIAEQKRRQLNEIEGQTFGTEHNGRNKEWWVEDIVEYIKNNNIKSQILDISSLEMSDADEEYGSEDFIKRVNKADLKYPIIVVKDEKEDKYSIVDGMHRVYKAQSQGLDKINAYILTYDDLNNIQPAEVFEKKTANINEAKADKFFKGDHRYLSTVKAVRGSFVKSKQIPFSLNFPAENKGVFGVVDTKDGSYSYDCTDFFDAYETLKRFIGPGNNIVFFNNKPMFSDDYKKAEQEVGPQEVRFVSEDGQDFIAFTEENELFFEDGLGDINKDIETTSISNNNNTKISPALSSVLASANSQENDDDLFQHIPDLDQKILKQYLNGMDKNNRSFFSRAEKANFLNKWKQKNLMKENIETAVHRYSYSIIRKEFNVWAQNHREISPITFEFRKPDISKIYAAIEEFEEPNDVQKIIDFNNSLDKGQYYNKKSINNLPVKVRFLNGFDDFESATRYVNSYTGPGIYIAINGIGLDEKGDRWELYYYNKDDEGWKMLGRKTHHILENKFPSFSTQEFSKDPEQIEFEHLLSLVKDPTDRQWIKASIDPKLPMKKQIRQLEKYIEYIRNISLKENNKKNKLYEDLLETPVIDLSQKQLDESFLRMFGYWIEKILGRMFDGDSSIPVKLKGTSGQIQNFTDVLSHEKRYAQALKQYGLDHPQAFKSKAELQKAIDAFERTTKIKWPLK